MLTNPENRGLAASLNRTLGEARGEYVARQDADDVSAPARFEKQIAFMDSHDDIGVLGTQAQIEDEHGGRVCVFRMPLSHGEIVWCILSDVPFVHPTVMMRRRVLAEAGGYDADWPVAQDIELWSRLFSRTRMANLPDALLRYRTHKNATTIRRTGEQRDRLVRARMLAAAQLPNLGDCEASMRLIERAQNDAAEHPLSNAEAREAMDFLSRLLDAARSAGHIGDAEADAALGRMLNESLKVLQARASHAATVPESELAWRYWQSVLPASLWRIARAIRRIGRHDRR